MGAGGRFGGCGAGCWGKELALDAVVDNEERRGGGGGAEEDGGETGVDSADCLAEGEFGLRCGGVACLLEAGFDGVEGVKGAVNCQACDGAGLNGFILLELDLVRSL